MVYVTANQQPNGTYGNGVAPITKLTNNSATSTGGALYVPGGVTNCTFVGNMAIDGGGAIYANALSDAGFVGCLFVSNHLTATKWAHGGAVRGAGGRVGASCSGGCFTVRVTL